MAIYSKETFTNSRALLLFSELVVIVVGVLFALAVDEWRDEKQLEVQRVHLLSTLLLDLEEDRADYEDFVDTALRRSEAAQYLISLSGDADFPTGAWTAGPGQAIFTLAYSARLQTSKSGYLEMVSVGNSSALDDDSLRSQILKYYSLADDRIAVNTFITPQIERFHVALEALGVSPTDKDRIDTETVLDDPAVSALIRTMGETAAFAPVYVADLLEANLQLSEAIAKALQSQ